MTEQQQCTGGDHPSNAGGITLCYECVSELKVDLLNVPGVWADLQVTIERRDVGAGSVGSSGHKAPQSVANETAMDLGETLRTILTGWARELEPRARALSAPNAAYWLTDRLNQVRTQDWAGDLKRELHEALNDARRATDRAPETITLGPCIPGCDGTMTATRGAKIGRCKTCGHAEYVTAYQQWRISEAWHVQAPLPDIIRWLHEAGHARIGLTKAKMWVSRGQLEPAHTTDDGRKLYTPAATIKTYGQTPTGKKDPQAAKQIQLVS